MSLVHPNRPTAVLGRYTVGGTSCLTDPSLVTLAQDYRRKAAARLTPLDGDGLNKKLPAAEYHCSLKIDGEFNVLVYYAGEAILLNPGGTARTGLPCLERIACLLGQNPLIQQIVLAGELYHARSDGSRARVHDVTRVARNPASQDELDALTFAAFDVIEHNGEPVRSFAWAWDFLETSGLDKPSAFRTKDQSEIVRRFEHWTQQGHEGIVLRSETAGSYKVKPRHSLHAVVIGFTEGSDDRAGLIHDLLLALIRPDGTFQVLGRVGSGFTDQDRRDWLCDLQDWVVASDYAEANDGLAYRMVWPPACHRVERSRRDQSDHAGPADPVDVP
jgi:hypothetical protein